MATSTADSTPGCRSAPVWYSEEGPDSERTADNAVHYRKMQRTTLKLGLQGYCTVQDLQLPFESIDLPIISKHTPAHAVLAVKSNNLAVTSGCWR